VRQPHTESTVQRKTRCTDPPGADEFGGTRAGAENIESVAVAPGTGAENAVKTERGHHLPPQVDEPENLPSSFWPVCRVDDGVW